MRGLLLALGVLILVACSFALGRDSGRSQQIVDDLENQAGEQALADCVLLHGREGCPH